MYSLFLDDIREPKQVKWVKLPLVDWIIVRNFDQFTTYIKLHGLPLRVAFDHDLGPENYAFDGAGNSTCPAQETGYDCVKWLVQYCIEHEKEFPEYYLHTMNEIGAKNMESYIQSFKRITSYDKIS